MNAPRLPTLDDLELSPELKELFLKYSAKKGILDWISQKTDVPILEHTFLRTLTLPIARHFAKQHENGILVRSNNYCEILPGTEGSFETWNFWGERDVNDSTKIRMLTRRPKCKQSHLKKDWPYNKKELRWASVEDMHPKYYCNMIEHPNQKDVFWMTFTNSTGTRFTIHPGINQEAEYNKEKVEEIQEKTNGGIEKILDAAKKVVSLEGFDNRYSKQMEFILTKNEFYLTQAKIFYPRNTTSPEIIPKNPEYDLYRTLGVFDIKAVVENPEEGRIEDQQVIRLVNDLQASAHKGHQYRKNISAVIFKDARGLLEHRDMPYILYSQGIAVGDFIPHALDKEGTPIPLNLKHGQRAHIKSDGHFLYLLD